MAFDIGVLKPLAGPAIGVLTKLNPVRRVRRRLARGKLCFRLPQEKIYILLPEREDGPRHFVVGQYDSDACEEIGQLLSSLGYRKGRDWDIQKVRPGRAIPQDMRRANLISLGGPSANSFLEEALAEYPDLLGSVRYVDGEQQAHRELCWHNRRYRTSQSRDFACMVTRKNPYNPERWLTVLFGLRAVGTYGAALLYSSGDYKKLRKEVEENLGTARGDLDILLSVDEGEDPPAVTNIRTAKPEDGIPIDSVFHPSSAGPDYNFAISDEYLRRLQLVGETVHAYNREILFSRLVFTHTITSDFDMRIEEEETLTAVDQDILIYHKYYVSTIPMDRIEDLEFHSSGDRANDGERVVWLPARNEPKRKEFLVFPLPPITVGTPARNLRFSMKFPGGANPLRNLHGHDLFQVLISPKAKGKVDLVEIAFRFEAPGTYQFERIQEQPGGVTGSTTSTQECKMNEPYRVQFRDVVGGTKYSFLVDRIA